MKTKQNTKTDKKSAKKSIKQKVLKSLKDVLKVKEKKNNRNDEIKKNTSTTNERNVVLKKKFQWNRVKTEKSSKPNPIKGNKKVDNSQQIKKYVKPNFELVESLKESWNIVRQRSIDTQTRNNLIEKMVNQMKGHLLQVSLRHDAARIVQCILQFGSIDQKELMIQEMTKKIFEIAKTQYGHFTILKAITYCHRPIDQKRIVQSLKGHFVSLGTNVIGCRTVESIMQLYPSNLTRSLKAEFYGQKFCILMPETPKNLKELMTSLPTKKSAILDHMRDLIHKFVSKSLLEFTFVHHLLWEYVQEIMSEEMPNATILISEETQKLSRSHDLVALLVEFAPQLLSSKPGAKAMCYIITMATAKDRKRIIKTLKGHCLESLLHDSAHLGIMRLVEVTDDTVNIQKSLLEQIKSIQSVEKYSATGERLDENKPPLLSIIEHKFGYRFLMHLLHPSSKIFDKDEWNLFQFESPFSKKSNDLRRKEHLLYLKSTLIKVVMQNMNQICRLRNGVKVIEAVIRVFHPKDLIECLGKTLCGVEFIVSEDEEMDVPEVGEDEVEGEVEEDTEYLEKGEEEEMMMMDEEADDNNEVHEESTEDEDGAKKDVVELSIEQDPITHQLIKKIIQFEVQIENHEASGTSASLDPLSIWSDPYDPSNSSLTHWILSCLEENELLLPMWLQCNRPCFVLLESSKLPSASQRLQSILKKQVPLLKEASKSHEGGKHLLKWFQSFK